MSEGDDHELAEELDGGDSPIADPSFPLLLEKLHEEHNFDFRQYKEASLLRRVRRRMAQVRVDRVDDYMTYLDQHADEHTALLDTILINVTRFFRDPEAWSVFRERVLPRLLERAVATRTVRVWSAGCSSGEEPYSLAILLAAALGARRDEYDVKIYATDIDEEALASARAGVYRLEQLKDVSPDLVERHFQVDGQTYRVRREIRRWCIFGRHDLTQDAPLSHIDLLVCRNVLIYFNGNLQNRVLPSFQYAVRPDGFLFLGRSESALARSPRFAPVDVKWRIFKRMTPSDGEAAGTVLPPRDPGARAVREPRPEPRGVSLGGILESLESAIVVIDPTETIAAWNGAAESVFEIPAASALGKKFRDLDMSYRIDGLRSRVEEVRSTRGRVRMPDVLFARRSGDMAHIDVTIAALDDEHRYGGVVISAQDSSELGRIREELERVGEQSATANEELQSTNEELETTNEELQSTNEELETTNEELQSTNEELETTVEELQSTNTELGALNAELERRTAELHRNATFQKAVLDSVGAALFVLDPDDVVTHWNDAAARMWGLRSDAALGREFFALPLGDVTRAARAALQRLKEARAPQRMQAMTYAAAGGEQRHAHLELRPIVLATGELLGVLGVATDDGVNGETR